VAKGLTAAAVEKLVAGSKRREVADGLLPGLYLVVQPSGKKSWAVRYRANGRSKKLTLGTYPALGLAEARSVGRAALIDVQKGGNPALQKRESRRRGQGGSAEGFDSFEAVAKRYLERYAKPKNRDWREAARLLGLRSALNGSRDDPKSFVLIPGGAAERFSGRPLADVTRRDILSLLDEIIDRGSPVSANRTLAALKRFIDWAAEQETIPVNPAAGIRAPSHEQPRDRVLTDDELRAVWKGAGEIGWPFAPIVHLLILTGQRRDEVGQMTWSEIKGDMWTLPRERSKNGRAHDVPLSVAAQSILAAVPRISGSDLVFTTNGRTPASGFSKWKERLDHRAQKQLRDEALERGEHADRVLLSPWRLHDLRRTVATGMARLGVNLPVIEKVLNHTSGSFAGIVGVYQRHDYGREKGNALNIWADYVVRLMDRP
jgi:integrase